MTIDDVVATCTASRRRSASRRARSHGKRHLTVSGNRPPQPRDAIFLGSGGNSVGTQSVEAEWMRLAGLKQRSLPGGRASLEMLRDTAAGSPVALDLSPDRTFARPNLARTSIGQLQIVTNMITVDGRPWTCAGPLMLGEVQRRRSQM